MAQITSSFEYLYPGNGRQVMLIYNRHTQKHKWCHLLNCINVSILYMLYWGVTITPPPVSMTFLFQQYNRIFKIVRCKWYRKYDNKNKWEANLSFGLIYFLVNIVLFTEKMSRFIQIFCPRFSNQPFLDWKIKKIDIHGSEIFYSTREHEILGEHLTHTWNIGRTLVKREHCWFWKHFWF